MSIKTIDDRVRAIGAMRYKTNVEAAVKGLSILITNTSAVRGLSYNGKDITDKQLIEVLTQHLIRTQSSQQEEMAVEDFMEAFKQIQAGQIANIAPDSTIGEVLKED